MESEGSRSYGKTMPSPIPNRSVRTVRAPIGVCGAVMPFNSPLAGVAWKVFPALLCGNAVVAKSHELTPYTAVAFGKLLRDAGLPRGLYSAVQGFGPEVGMPLVRDERVGVVSFTGSATTGKLIQKSVSERRVLAKVCLELGGKNPLVVCDDADLQVAAEHAINSAFIDAGQRCASGSRIIVFRQVYDDFRQAVVKRAEAVKVGSGPADDCGPVISRAEPRSNSPAIQAAVKRGARILTGGTTVDPLGAGYYIAPTILDDVALDDELSQEELFGPVTCLYRVKDFDEAIGARQLDQLRPHRRDSHLQQQSHRGVRGQVPGGLVSINGPTYGAGPHMPFGGVKNSGNGFREPGTEALDVYSEWKTVVVNHDPAPAYDHESKAAHLFSDYEPRVFRAQPAADQKAASPPGDRARADPRRLDSSRQVQPPHRRRHQRGRLHDFGVALQRHRRRQPRGDGEDGVSDRSRSDQQPLHVRPRRRRHLRRPVRAARHRHGGGLSEQNDRAH